MKIRFVQSCSTDGPSYAAGRTYEVPKAEADGFLAAGLAVADAPAGDIETAVVEPEAETAADTPKRTGKGRK